MSSSWSEDQGWVRDVCTELHATLNDKTTEYNWPDVDVLLAKLIPHTLIFSFTVYIYI